MVFYINNESYTLEKSNDLNSILKNLEIAENGIAVALNENVIHSPDWSKTFVQNGDKILIIKATQGG